MSQVIATLRGGEAAALSQWRLTVLRFRRHRLALASMYLLIFLYLLALGADFVAPYRPEQRHLEYAYAPPQPVYLDGQGVYTTALERHVDPITFRKSYTTDSSRRVPLRFAFSGEPYRLLGLIPARFHLVGVDNRGQERISGAPEGAGGTFFFLGADRYGRDIFSRTLHGARVSLSVGLVVMSNWPDRMQ